MITDDVPSVADRFAEINGKLDKIAKAVGLLLAASASLPTDVNVDFLRELGWRPTKELIVL